MKCPRCNGEGSSQGIACGPSGCRTGPFKCSTCKGTGEITEDRQAKIVAGKAMREARVERHVSQSEEAKRLGIDVGVYSRIEFGIHDGEESKAVADKAVA